MALVCLAHQWARRRGGSVQALVVDHGLRPESAQEASWVASEMHRHDIGCTVLRWAGKKPQSGIQHAAREARYRLLEHACHEAGILHLLFGHHAGDQAETQQMRASRSGAMGLAGISMIRELPYCRILRPLLGVRKEQLRAWLTGQGQEWVEDPSNQSAAYARNRLRQRDAPLSISQEAYATRLREEQQLSDAMAQAVSLWPIGAAQLDRSALEGVPRAVQTRLLQQLLTCLRGTVKNPRGAEVERVWERLSNGAQSATLHGCRILQDTQQPQLLWLGRESARCEPPCLLPAGKRVRWDGRFVVMANTSGFRIGAMGVEGYRSLRDAGVPLPGLPRVLLESLPVLWVGENCHFPWGTQAFQGVSVRFAPRLPLTYAPFAMSIGPL